MNLFAGLILVFSIFLRFKTFEIKKPEVQKSIVNQELIRLENMLKR